MPKREMKPMTEGMLMTPPVSHIAMMPPMRAKGRLRSMRADCLMDRNSFHSRSKMTMSDTSETMVRVRMAVSWLSNCPPYSMW